MAGRDLALMSVAGLSEAMASGAFSAGELVESQLPHIAVAAHAYELRRGPFAPPAW